MNPQTLYLLRQAYNLLRAYAPLGVPIVARVLRELEQVIEDETDDALRRAEYEASRNA